MLVCLSELLEHLCVIPFHELSLLLGLSRTLVIFYVMLSFAKSGVNHGNWLTFCRIMSLGDPSRRMLMMARECTSTCYVLFWTVVLPVSDPKDLFVEHVTMSTVKITGLIWVGLVE
jgi:hypothetical protein